jgi:hypothetical protein
VRPWVQTPVHHKTKKKKKKKKKEEEEEEEERKKKNPILIRCSTIFNKGGVSNFHFAIGPTNYIADPISRKASITSLDFFQILFTHTLLYTTYHS